ncbi:MAG: UbiA family prenyltransferase [Acidobacteria bacterium]|nr:UbiA family prenyltransferase [Acidobacteriota bacterium]MCA1618405.1 UbiA family prenyltransferase [Acidobacteriota bacterium]
MLPRVVRAVDWWEFKLSPIFATVYATALLLNVSIASLWPLLLLALAALVPGAAYVSVINDLTDMEEDAASGKSNRLVGRSRVFVAVVLTCCVLPGVAVAVYWRGDALLLSLYLAAWAAFTLYSVPPVRLKKRGVLGLLADASGAHLFPTLLVVVLVFRWSAVAPDSAWFATVAVWSLSLGLRGNLWHQLGDRQHDERVGLRTFARRHKITLLQRVGNFVIFPSEAVAFAVMLRLVGSRAAVVALVVYLLLEWSRRMMWRTDVVVVVPKERSSILMLEYYEVFFPVALLLSSATLHRWDALVLVAHLLLFPGRATRVLKDVLKLLKQAAFMFVETFRRSGS